MCRFAWLAQLLDVRAWRRAGPRPLFRHAENYNAAVLLGHRRAIRHSAAFLVGTSGYAPPQSFRAQVEYEF